MTLRSAINSGKLPNLDEGFYIVICKDLFINAKDLDYELKDGELEKLKYNTKVNYLYVGERLKKAHNKLIGNYQELIDKYKKLSNEMGEKEYLKDAKKDLDDLLEKLDKSRKDYEQARDNINLNNVNINLDEMVLSERDEKKLEKLDDKTDELQEKLDNKYKELNKIENSSFQTKKGKKQNQKRIEKVKKRIEKLQKKQGKLQSKQQRIVSKGNQKYIGIKQNEYKDYLSELESINEYQNRRVQLKNEENLYENDIKQTQELIDNLNGKKDIVSKFNKRKLEKNRKSLESNRNTLRHKGEVLDELRNLDKQGTVNFSTQIYKYVSRVYAYGL